MVPIMSWAIWGMPIDMLMLIIHTTLGLSWKPYWFVTTDNCIDIFNPLGHGMTMYVQMKKLNF